MIKNFIIFVLVILLIFLFFQTSQNKIVEPELGNQLSRQTSQSTYRPKVTSPPVQKLNNIPPVRFTDISRYTRIDPNNNKKQVFAVYTANFRDDPEVWDSIILYAKEKEYAPPGTTYVFFFNTRQFTPDVTSVAEKFDKMYMEYCVAGFWQYSSFKTRFHRWPFM